jgi:hypothetical protein
MPVHLIPHPPYSPDLAPSDFFLFESLKTKMLGLEFDCPGTLLDWIKAEFQRIPSEVLERVFESWIICFQKCIEHEGDYFAEEQISTKTVSSQIAYQSALTKQESYLRLSGEVGRS